MEYAQLAETPLFAGSTQAEIEQMLCCLHARKRAYQKNESIYRAGEQVREFGLVLSGSVSIEQDDLWGNSTMLDRVEPGSVFAETYACVPGEALMVNVTALSDTQVLFMDIQTVLTVCSSACAYHLRLIRNLLAISAQKNLSLSRRSLHTAARTIRGRVVSYLSFQAVRQGRRDFEIPLNRQQLASYLNVDRSALSTELNKMQKEGLLTCQKNHFVISERVT